MLAQILPGLREARGPLASGFLWLLVGWLILHKRVANADGEIGEAVELLQNLPEAVLGGAAAFTAYIVGSISGDIFGPILNPVAVFGAGLTPRHRPPLDEYSSRRMSHDLIRTQVVQFENEANRLDSEIDLRLRLVPALATLTLDLAIKDNGLWLLCGFLLVAALLVQVCYRARDAGYATDAAKTLRDQSKTSGSTATSSQ